MGQYEDHLRLKGLRFWGRHGHLPFEQDLGNRFEVDVDILLDASRAAEVDRIDLTVDLAKVYEVVRRQMEGDPCHLIETLAVRIATELAQLDKVETATVRVRKIFPPFKGATEGVMEAEASRIHESDEPF